VNSESVTVAEVAGKTVVVNNKRDGIRKYSLFFLGILISVLLQYAKAKFPNHTAEIDKIVDFAIMLFPSLGTLALTSPFDKRGVVIDKDNSVSIPERPESPGYGVGISIFVVAFVGIGFLTGCAVKAETIPQREAVKISQPLPLAPIVTASKDVQTKKVPAVSIKKVGAEPGETFSTQSGASCEMRRTVDGWVSVCPQPTDGDEFSIRESLKNEFPNLLTKQ
jgi:hypothetical protein